MNACEHLKEIELNYNNGIVTSEFQLWLIQRVHRLTVVLEETKEIGLSAHGKSVDEMIFKLGLMTGTIVKALEEE